MKRLCNVFLQPRYSDNSVTTTFFMARQWWSHYYNRFHSTVFISSTESTSNLGLNSEDRKFQWRSMLVFKWGGVAGESLAILISLNSLSLFFFGDKTLCMDFFFFKPQKWQASNWSLQYLDQTNRSWQWGKLSPRWNVFVVYNILLTSSIKKYMRSSEENMHVDIGA